MKDIFAHRGILNDILSAVSLSNSLKLRNLASEWEIDVVTSNLHFPKFNGLIERNVQKIKQLLKKSDDSRQDAFVALSEFRDPIWQGGKLCRIADE